MHFDIIRLAMQAYVVSSFLGEGSLWRLLDREKHQAPANMANYQFFNRKLPSAAA